MSVKKYDVTVPKSYKDALWGTENVSKWFLKILLDVMFFFTIYMIIDFYIGLDSLTYQFLGIFCSYILADVISFFAAYIITKFLSGWIFKRNVKPFYRTIKSKLSRKKLWIYLFTTMFETIFFSISLVVILADMVLSLPVWMAYILIWIGLGMLAKGLGRFLYFIFYQF